MPELHNQNPVKTTLDLTKRIAYGQPGQSGSDNMVLSVFAKELVWGSDFKKTTLDFTVAGYQDYTLEQYEMLEYITVKYTSSVGTFKVGTAAHDDLYVESSDENSAVLFIYKIASNASQRKIRITLTEPGEVNIKSVINL
jgi:hypothetical protein